MKWISVEKKLPGEGQPPAFHYCIVAKENKAVLEAMFNSKTQEFMSRNFKKLNHPVTHWMPLPKPPRQ